MTKSCDIGYSVAIRTLGLNPDVLRKVLESVHAQTVAPSAVTVYIAEGYKAPDFRVGMEVYKETPKGMMRQRALDYKDVTTAYILMLDDDVILYPDSVAKMLEAMVKGYGCVAPDVFGNQTMPTKGKIMAAFSNMVFPHDDTRFAFKVMSNGSFAYLRNPEPRLYPSQSASGPCSMWRKDEFLATDVPQELWLEGLGFPYCEDQITFYKYYLRGGRLGIHYGAQVANANAQTSSGTYHKDTNKLYKRARAQYVVWHRSIYSWRSTWWSKAHAVTAFTLKLMWLIPVHVFAAIRYKDISAPYQLLRGTVDGIKYTKTEAYRSLSPYKTKRRER